MQAQNRGGVKKNGGGDQITEVGMAGSVHLEAKGGQMAAVGLPKLQLCRGAGQAADTMCFFQYACEEALADSHSACSI